MTTDIYVSSGVTSTGLTIQPGQDEIVLSGGTASNTTVTGISAEQDISGGTAVNTTLENYGVEYVASGGVASSTTIDADSVMVLGGSATGSGTVVNASGLEQINGGLASGSVVNNGGDEVIGAGSTVVGATLDGGSQFAGGGTVSDTTISSGWEYVGSGATVTGTVVNPTGTQQVGGTATFDYYYGGTTETLDLSGGIVSDTTVTGIAATQNVSNGGTAIDTTLENYGVSYVASGGVVSGTTIDADSVMVLGSGAAGSGTVVNGSGLEQLVGVASGSVVNSGGLELVYSGGDSVSTTLRGGAQIVGGNGAGSASDTVVSAGGVQYVGSSSTVSGAVVSSGGIQQVGGSTTYPYYYGGTTVSADLSGGVVSGTTVSSGGKENVSSGGTTVSTTVTGGGSAVVFSSGTASGTVVSSGGHLVVSSGGSITGTDLVSGGSIDLTYAPYVSGASSQSFNSSTDVLTVYEGGSTYTFQMAGAYTGEQFHLSNDGSGDTLITLAPCYCAGTHIAAERGDIAVEALRVGDLVRTLSGALRPVVWIGHRLVDCRRHPHPEHIWPVRVRAGALAEGMPARDLLLSPDHSLYREDVLIPVKYLINGATIVQERADTALYFHVELDRHDILLAEGVPAESYLDTGNRLQFVGGAAHLSLHPDFAPLSWDNACAPLCLGGAAVQKTRQRLLARAAELGWTGTDSSELHLLADGHVIRAARIKGKLHQFALPRGCKEARIISRTGVPAGFDLANADCRQLGARIGAVLIDGESIPLDSPVLAAGFHALEGGGGVLWRWTDGAALLRLPAPLPRPATLELLVRDTMRHWTAPEAAASRLVA